MLRKKQGACAGYLRWDEEKKYLSSDWLRRAFIDYETTAGWTFSSCRARAWGRTRSTSNRLYKNNRDGTFTDLRKSGTAFDWLGVRRLRRRL